MKKRGISLIVLIITIIVIIILAVTVILTLSKNNPIESTKEATFKEDLRSFQNELNMYISRDYTNKAGQRDNKITATGYENDTTKETYDNSVYKYISSYKSKYIEKFVIINDELMYNTRKLTDDELKWCIDLGIKEKTKTTAEEIADAAEDGDQQTIQEYYGARVLNYESNGISDWKIFYSDGNNLYLITSDYIPQEKVVLKNNSRPLFNNDTTKGGELYTVKRKYNGSEDITEDKIKNLNSSYFKLLESKKINSTYDNMKDVAYLLDTSIWNVFAEGKEAEYAIGGPSVEMLINSYTQKYSNKNLLTKATSEIGYQLSNDGGNSWIDSLNSIIDENDTLYVLPQESNVPGLWLSSPSNNSENSVMRLYYNGSVTGVYDQWNPHGFRPIVCLKSDVILTEVTGGFNIE